MVDCFIQSVKYNVPIQRYNGRITQMVFANGVTSNHASLWWPKLDAHIFELDPSVLHKLKNIIDWIIVTFFLSQFNPLISIRGPELVYTNPLEMI